jgi:hypothetical protein
LVPGADPDDARAVVLGCDRPGDMGAVAVVVLAGVPGEMQFVPSTALASRSGWPKSMPVSITATPALLAGFAVPGEPGKAARMRRIPVGIPSPVASVSSAWDDAVRRHRVDLGVGSQPRHLAIREPSRESLSAAV